MTKPIIVVRVPCKLLYVIQVKEFLIKCSTSWPYLISEFLVAYITIVASDWPRTFFTPKVFLFSMVLYSSTNDTLNCSDILSEQNIIQITCRTVHIYSDIMSEYSCCSHMCPLNAGKSLRACELFKL